MEGIIFAIQYVENSKRYHFHQTNMQNQSSIYQFFHYNSLKTVFYKIPTANYICFLIGVIMKMKLLIRLQAHHF